MLLQKLKKRDLFLERNYKRDRENRIVVNMTVKDDSDFLSVFSENSAPVISTDVAEFIESITASIPPGEPLTLRIRSGCIDEREKALYREAIAEYYSEKYVVNERERKRNNIIAVILTIAGVLTLVLEIFLEFWRNSPIWTEVIDIVAWVFLWEAVDISVFGNRTLRVKRGHYLSYLSMKVEYVGLDEG